MLDALIVWFWLHPEVLCLVFVTLILTVIGIVELIEERAE